MVEENVFARGYLWLKRIREKMFHDDLECLVPCFGASILYPDTITSPTKSRRWEDRCASNEIWTILAVGGATAVEKGGRAALGKTQEKREYDPTKGYPGEDILDSH